jgi:hypothetical protein
VLYLWGGLLRDPDQAQAITAAVVRFIIGVARRREQR